MAKAQEIQNPVSWPQLGILVTIVVVLLTFVILDGIAKEAENTGRHAAKTGQARDNTPDYDKLSR